MPERLKVGLLMDSYSLAHWEYVMVERLLQAHYCDIVLVILKQGGKQKPSLWQSRSKFLFRVYNALDRRLYKVQRDAFERVDARELLADIPSIEVETKSTRISDRFPPEDVETIRNHDVDILIRLGFAILRGDVLHAPKHGIWSYHHSDNDVLRGGPAAFWEVMLDWDCTGSILQILTEDIDGGPILYRSQSRTYKRSVRRNRNAMYWKSLSFLPRRLEQLYNLGADAFFARVERSQKPLDLYSNPLFRLSEPTNWTMLKLGIPFAWRAVASKLTQLRYHYQWILLFRIQKGLDASFWRFKKILPPKDRFYADPFVVHRDGKYYVFLEECLRGNPKGFISLLVLDEKGNQEGETTRILEKPYHLSFPFILEHDGDYYMIPESRQDKTIQLYKCVDWPHKWEWQRNLMEDVDAVDTTLFFHDDKWWLFANMMENEGAPTNDELFLFHADHFDTEKWTPHPLNPVVSDVRCARPAGRIFEHEGRIIRPGQNNGKTYGYGMKFHQVTVLSETDYQEVELASVEPNWSDDVLATHTFNRDGELTIIDALWKRPRLF